MRLEHTLEGLLVYLAHYYTNWYAFLTYKCKNEAIEDQTRREKQLMILFFYQFIYYTWNHVY